MRPPAARPDRLALRLPVCPESVGIGRRAAARFAAEHGCDEETLARLRLAVSEALSNVVLHAYPAEDAARHHLGLVAESEPAEVRVTISDDGTGLHARPDSPGMGFGLGLMARLCNALTLDVGRDGGTIVCMSFSR